MRAACLLLKLHTEEKVKYFIIRVSFGKVSRY